MALQLSLLAAASAAAKDPPNVLLIVIDDLGHDDMGFAATSPQIKTPVMDNFAKEGRILKDYYVQPSCSPTRATIMSGRYPLHTGIDSFIPGGEPYGLSVNETTLADMLTGAGYASHAIGKWHLGLQNWESTPTFRGFRSFYGFYNGGEDYYSHVTNKGYDMRRDTEPHCGADCSQVAWDAKGIYSTFLFTTEAVKVVEAHDPKKEPLFLYLAYQAVHAPAESPKEYQEPYKAMGLTGTRLVYAGMIACMDEGIGNVTSALDKKGMLDNTLLIFTTDNGGPSETCAKQGSSNYPLRGSKCSIWEGGTRGVSTIWSGRGDFGTTTDFQSLMHAADWMPTLAEATGVTCPTCKPWDGVSQWGQLKGTNKTAARDHIYYGVTDFQVGYHGPAVRQGCYKLINGDGGKPGLWPNAANDTIFLEEVTSDPSFLVNTLPLPPNKNETLLFNVCDDEGEHHALDDKDPANVKIINSLMTIVLDHWATGVPACHSSNKCPGYTPGCSKGSPTTVNGTKVWVPWC